MSLKAYDGMMTTKSMKFVQDEIHKRMDKFREASENKLLKKYVEMAVDYVDDDLNPNKFIELNKFSLDDDTEKKLKDIKVKDDTTLLSLIYQISNICNQSYFVNGFMVHLNIDFEIIDDNKTLVMPNIFIEEHRKILLEFLTDWYAENQCDPPKNVPEAEYEQRIKDWYGFNEVDGFDFRIRLFKPDHWENINKTLRGDKLIKGILNNLPTDEKRIRRIAIDKIIKENREIKELSDYMNARYYYLKKEEGMKEFDEYIKKSNIQPTLITKELLIKPLLENGKT
jgi:hypothetical protein